MTTAQLTRPLRPVSLPTPRGPSSAWVLDRLRGRGPAAGPSVHHDGLGDDVQLALYLAYESHFSTLPGVVGDVEWDPALITFRRSLEDAFEAALRASEEQFRRAIEDAPVPVIMQAEDGRVLQVSQSWSASTGFEATELPTFDAWLDHADAPGAARLRERLRALFDGRSEVVEAELEMTTRAGAVRHWIFAASAPGRRMSDSAYTCAAGPKRTSAWSTTWLPRS